MDKLWVVIKREYLERVRSRWFIFSTVFGPVFFAAITILPGYLTVKGMKNQQVAAIRIIDPGWATNAPVISSSPKGPLPICFPVRVICRQ